jgi:hypothetical protein
MLTATVRDLHRAHPNQFETFVETSAPPLWENNPFVSNSNDRRAAARLIDMHYPLINESNSKPLHFIHGYTQYLESQLGISIPVSEFKGDIHLSPSERSWENQVVEAFQYRGPYWILIAGGKYDFTAKWWSPDYYQQVVDHFKGRIQFVQCGSREHWHPKIQGCYNLVGKTDQRQFVRLVYHASGVLCPVTFAMHLAAAVPTKNGHLRPCVVVAGGREPPHWEAYPGHQFLHTVGALPCCATGGCWKSRCQTVGDGDSKDRGDLCQRPVQVRDELRIPQCMMMIKPSDVIAAIERYLVGQQGS